MGNITTHKNIALHIMRELRDAASGHPGAYRPEDEWFFELGNWLTDMSQLRDPAAFIGAKLTVWGRVVELMRTETMGLVGVKMGIRNEEGVESAPGSATVAFPLRGGPALPYPFLAPEDRAIETIAVLQNGEDK